MNLNAVNCHLYALSKINNTLDTNITLLKKAVAHHLAPFLNRFNQSNNTDIKFVN